ncbi:MAG: hypothetical protein IPH11_08525 [Ignavibacteriales bacterium]|nr:hypothetical protein [Ignavibacteriales bacterium]
MDKDNIIYVRFIDGGNVSIPIQSKYISENTYELLPNIEFDFNDKTILFEFGPEDIVETKPSKSHSGLVASILIKPGNQNNSFKRLLFFILNDDLTFDEAKSTFNKSDLGKLNGFIESDGFVYPRIKDFFEKYKIDLQEYLDN